VDEGNVPKRLFSLVDSHSPKKMASAVVRGVDVEDDFFAGTHETQGILIYLLGQVKKTLHQRIYLNKQKTISHKKYG
jgi:hypothetical protein